MGRGHGTNGMPAPTLADVDDIHAILYYGIDRDYMKFSLSGLYNMSQYTKRYLVGIQTSQSI